MADRTTADDARREVTVVAIVTAAPGKQDELALELEALVGPTRTESGCLQYDLGVDVQDAGRFVFVERWISQQHLDQHRRAPHLDAFRGRAAQLLGGPIEVVVTRPTTAD